MIISNLRFVPTPTAFQAKSNPTRTANLGKCHRNLIVPAKDIILRYKCTDGTGRVGIV